MLISFKQFNKYIPCCCASDKYNVLRSQMTSECGMNKLRVSLEPLGDCITDVLTAF